MYLPICLCLHVKPRSINKKVIRCLPAAVLDRWGETAGGSRTSQCVPSYVVFSSGRRVLEVAGQVRCQIPGLGAGLPYLTALSPGELAPHLSLHLRLRMRAATLISRLLRRWVHVQSHFFTEPGTNVSPLGFAPKSHSPRRKLGLGGKGGAWLFCKRIYSI